VVVEAEREALVLVVVVWEGVEVVVGTAPVEEDEDVTDAV